MHLHSPIPSGQPTTGPSRTQQHFACENILVQFSDPRKYFYSENARLAWSCSVSPACLASRENKQKRICGHQGMDSNQTNVALASHQHASQPTQQSNGISDQSPERPLSTKRSSRREARTWGHPPTPRFSEEVTEPRVGRGFAQDPTARLCGFTSSVSSFVQVFDVPY